MAVVWFKGPLMSPMFNLSFLKPLQEREFHAFIWLARCCFVLCRHMPGDRTANESAAWEELLLHMFNQSGFLHNRTTALVRMFHVTETSVCARPAVPFPALSWLLPPLWPDIPLSSASLGLFCCDLSAVRTAVWPPLLFVSQMLSHRAPVRKQTTAGLLQTWFQKCSACNWPTQRLSDAAATSDLCPTWCWCLWGSAQ